MKYKHILIIFLIGLIINIVGIFFKLMHWPGTSVIFLIATVTEITAIILLIYKLIKDKNQNSFLNK